VRRTPTADPGPAVRDRRRARPGRASHRNKSWSTKIGFFRQWVSSDWPVCPISKTTSPRRVGRGRPTRAAIHYSRWSEAPAKTNTDAPHLIAPTGSGQNSGTDGPSTANQTRRMNRAWGSEIQQAPVRRNSKSPPDLRESKNRMFNDAADHTSSASRCVCSFLGFRLMREGS
jgi:hypothetical protein